MKSWWIQTKDGAMALELRDIAVPQPGPGQVCIRIRAAALRCDEAIPLIGVEEFDGADRAHGKSLLS